jgi:hypothetical protein
LILLGKKQDFLSKQPGKAYTEYHRSVNDPREPGHIRELRTATGNMKAASIDPANSDDGLLLTIAGAFVHPSRCKNSRGKRHTISQVGLGRDDFLHDNQ